MNPELQLVLQRLVDLMRETAEKLTDCYDSSNALVVDNAINTLPVVIVALSNASNGLNAIAGLE